MENNSNLKTMALRADQFLTEKGDSLNIRYLTEHKLSRLLAEFAEIQLFLSSPIVPEVIEWEYTEYSNMQKLHHFDLEKRGKEGWELCGFDISLSGIFTYIFKRKKQKQ